MRTLVGLLPRNKIIIKIKELEGEKSETTTVTNEVLEDDLIFSLMGKNDEKGFVTGENVNSPEIKEVISKKRLFDVFAVQRMFKAN